MGKRGKRRQTAKTGDKRIKEGYYPSRNEQQKEQFDSDDDDMYDRVDRFHNRRQEEEDEEFLRFDQGSDKEETQDEGEETGILDLKDDSDDDEEENMGDAEEEEEEEEESDDEDEESSSSEEEEIEMEEKDVLDWGKRKSSYYDGDKANLDVEDAYLEEEAAQQVLEKRHEQMEEDDFMLSSFQPNQQQKDDNQQDKTTNKKALDNNNESSRTNVAKMSSAAKRKWLKSHHPEMLPLLEHFSTIIQQWNQQTRIAHEALTTDDASPEDVGATKLGIEYLKTKSILQACTALNVVGYLLLKAQEQPSLVADNDNDTSTLLAPTTMPIASHPVIATLKRLNTLSDQLQETVEDKVDNLTQQLQNLVQAAALIKSGKIDDDDDDDDSSQDESKNKETEEEEDDNMEKKPSQVPVATPASDSSSDDNDSSDDDEDNDLSRHVLNEARFGLRPDEVAAEQQKKKQQPQRKRRPMLFDNDRDEGATSHKRAANLNQSLSTTINSIEQRASTLKQRQRGNQHVEQLEDPEERKLREGLDMMEAALGPPSSDEDEKPQKQAGKKDKRRNDSDSSDGGNEFYSQIEQKSRAKKKARKDFYAVAPKYPGMDEEIVGERAISRTILKNRGLVAHKAKINRNPRVKKREQFRKATIRRKGQVRDVRTGVGHNYGGEDTGINVGVSKSRKLRR